MINDAVQSIIEKMKRHRLLYEQNEQAVRDQIVNPLLKNLGWDTENPDEVQPNVSTEEGIPDYSLFKDGKPVLFIEAKKLSVDIEDKQVVKQLAKYCFGEGMKYGVLTNGAVWILFNAFQEGTTMADRVLWKVDIEGDELTSSIKRLNIISKGNVENVETLVRKLQILDEIWESLLEEPKEIIKGLIPVFDGLIKEGYPNYEFQPSDIEDFIRERVRELLTSASSITPGLSDEPVVWQSSERQGKMKIGGEVFDIRNSFDILVNTGNWLIQKGKLKKSDCPVSAGYKRNLIHIEPKHKYGDNFMCPKQLSNGLWMETKYSNAGSINSARRLLERYGFKGDILEVK
jgi:hypothetical protein